MAAQLTTRYYTSAQERRIHFMFIIICCDFTVIIISDLFLLKCGDGVYTLRHHSKFKQLNKEENKYGYRY